VLPASLRIDCLIKKNQALASALTPAFQAPAPSGPATEKATPAVLTRFYPIAALNQSPQGSVTLCSTRLMAPASLRMPEGHAGTDAFPPLSFFCFFL